MERFTFTTKADGSLHCEALATVGTNSKGQRLGLRTLRNAIPIHRERTAVEVKVPTGNHYPTHRKGIIQMGIDNLRMMLETNAESLRESPASYVDKFVRASGLDALTPEEKRTVVKAVFA